jgi:hypothetical protein
MSGIARFHPAGLPGFSNIKKAAKSLGFLQLSITTKNFPESTKLTYTLTELACQGFFTTEVPPFSNGLQQERWF